MKGTAHLFKELLFRRIILINRNPAQMTLFLRNWNSARMFSHSLPISTLKDVDFRTPKTWLGWTLLCPGVKKLITQALAAYGTISKTKSSPERMFAAIGALAAQARRRTKPIAENVELFARKVSPMRPCSPNNLLFLRPFEGYNEEKPGCRKGRRK